MTEPTEETTPLHDEVTSDQGTSGELDPGQELDAQTPADEIPTDDRGKDAWQGRASDPREIPSLGHRDGKFHFSFQLRDVDSVNDPGQHEANAAETARQATKHGWLLTEIATIVQTVKSESPADDRGRQGGMVTYAAPAVRNTLENNQRLAEENGTV
jgi:hypothetical protein